MKFRKIIGLLIVLISCSCIHRTSKSKVGSQKNESQNLDWNSGLRIENGPNLGIFYTDSQGTEYSHAHKQITLTNDTTHSINLQIALSNEFAFPVPYRDQKFKAIIWPQELTPADEVKGPYTISNELRHFLEYGTDTSGTLHISIEPHEKYVLTIGTLHLKSTNYYVSPNVLFVHGNGGVFGECENLMSQDKSTNTSILLGIKLDIPNVGCTIIACGQISYAEH